LFGPIPERVFEDVKYIQNSKPPISWINISDWELRQEIRRRKFENGGGRKEVQGANIAGSDREKKDLEKRAIKVKLLQLLEEERRIDTRTSRERLMELLRNSVRSIHILEQTYRNFNLTLLNGSFSNLGAIVDISGEQNSHKPTGRTTLLKIRQQIDPK
jgi:hypothetical protein